MNEKRLRISTQRIGPYEEWYAEVKLDHCPVYQEYVGSTSEEARAAAQAYVDELIKHFREGGT